MANISRETFEAFLQWNMRGIYARREELKCLVSNHRPVAIALQETLLRPEGAFTLRGYKAHRRDVQPNQGGRAHGGVMVLVRDNIHFTPVTLTTPLQAVAVTLHTPLRLTICSIYLPDQGWREEELESLFKQLPPPIMVMGDFNCHNSLWGSSFTDKKGQGLEEVVQECGLVVMNEDCPTHFSSASGTLTMIDLTIASPSISRIMRWRVLKDLYQSDHFPLLISNSCLRNDFIAPPKWDLKTADWEAYAAGFPVITLTGDINADTEKLTNAVAKAAEKSIRRTNPCVGRNPVPWWSSEIGFANRKKRKALTIFRNHPTHENLVAFKRARAAERQLKRKSQRQSLRDYISTLTPGTSVSDVWRKIRALTGRRSSPLVPILNTVAGLTITDPKDVANILGRHYAQVSSDASYTEDFCKYKALEEIKGLDDSVEAGTEAGTPYNSLFTMAELKKVLLRASNSAPGKDDIPYELLRRMPQVYLLELFNSIWAQGRYPDAWREAIVVPILKDGKDPDRPESFRPISLTCCLSKVLESMANARLVWYLEKHRLLSTYQAGFRKRYSAVDHLVHFENYVQETFLERNHALGVFFDLAKAYDTTWRYGILHTLHGWGLRGNLLQFLKSFLALRTFRVRIGSALSDLWTQKNGIPQGSVLSCILFAVAINGIADGVHPSIERALYVDDLSIVTRGLDIVEVGERLQSAIDIISRAAEMRGFQFSPLKTSCIHFCRLRKAHLEPSLYLSGSVIPFKDKVRFLGLLLDRKLTWGSHIKHLIDSGKKLLTVLRVLCSLRWGADQEIVVRAVCTLVRTRIEYGSQAYGSARPSRLRKLDVLMNAGLRLATGAFRTTPKLALCRLANVQPLHFRREEVMLRYREKLRAFPQHYLSEMLNESAKREVYRHLPTRTRPLGIRAEELAARVALERVPLITYRNPRIPPWHLPLTEIDISLSRYKKDETAATVFRKLFAEALQRYSGWNVVFTDGSKSQQGVGCAWFFEGVRHLSRLYETSAVFTAEIWALILAVECISQKAGDRWLICSDSLSTLTAARDILTDDPLIRRLLEALEDVRASGRQIKLFWAPSHMGIEGNEEADRAARAAVSLSSPLLPLHLNDRLRHIRSITQQRWLTVWRVQDTLLRKNFPDANPIRWPEGLTRKDKSVLARVATGHTRLTHSHLLLGAERPRCPHCEAELSVVHVVDHCTAFTEARLHHGLTVSLREALQEDEKIRALLSFIKAIRLYDEL